MNASRIALALALPLAVAACSSSTTSSNGAADGGDGASSTDDPNQGPDAAAGGSVGLDAAGSVNPTNPGDAATNTPIDAGGGAKAPVNDATLVLNIPTTFKGTTRELDVVVTPTVPIAGPPAGILYQVEKPVITAGQALTVHGDTTGINGSYYVVVVLYMQGGGEFSPTSGVDYETQSPAVIKFDATSIDLGTLSLALASSDGGM